MLVRNSLNTNIPKYAVVTKSAKSPSSAYTSNLVGYRILFGFAGQFDGYSNLDITERLAEIPLGIQSNNPTYHCPLGRNTNEQFYGIVPSPDVTYTASVLVIYM